MQRFSWEVVGSMDTHKNDMLLPSPYYVKVLVLAVWGDMELKKIDL